METSDDFDSIRLFDTETGEIVDIPSELMSAVESGEVIEWLNSIGIMPLEESEE